jgi:hypothetical protein
MMLDKIDAVRVEKASSTSCHLRLGSSTFKTPTDKLRGLSMKGIYEESGYKKEYTGLVFYNLGKADSDVVCSLLNPQTIITGIVA